MSMSVAFNSAPPVQTPTRPAPRGGEEQLSPLEKIREAAKSGEEQQKTPLKNDRSGEDGAPNTRQTGRRVDFQV
jgi:hypothetical protein